MDIVTIEKLKKRLDIIKKVLDLKNISGTNDSLTQ